MESRKSQPAPSQAKPASSIMCHISIKNSPHMGHHFIFLFSSCFMCIFVTPGQLSSWRHTNISVKPATTTTTTRKQTPNSPALAWPLMKAKCRSFTFFSSFPLHIIGQVGHCNLPAKKEQERERDRLIE